MSASVGSIEMTGRAVEGDVPQIVSTQSGMTHGFRCEQGNINPSGEQGKLPPKPDELPPPSLPHDIVQFPWSKKTIQLPTVE